MISKSTLFNGLTLVFIVVGIAFVIAWFQEPAPLESTEIQVLNPVLNLGRIDQDSQTITGEFLIVNQGQNPLWISKIWTSCHCTSPEEIKVSTLPGDTLSFAVTYNGDRVGKFSELIKIYGNFKGATIQLRLVGAF